MPDAHAADGFDDFVVAAVADAVGHLAHHQGIAPNQGIHRHPAGHKGALAAARAAVEQLVPLHRLCARRVRPVEMFARHLQDVRHPPIYPPLF
jgi:dihydrodipicolinate synthase/N-acetylneuraminate lyase